MQKGAYGYRTQEKILKAFGQADLLWPKKPLAYPKEAEDAYISAVKDYADKVCAEIDKALPAIRADYSAMLNDPLQMDSSDSDGMAEGFLRSLMTKFAGVMTAAALTAAIHKMAQDMRKGTVGAWHKSVKDTIGVEIDDDYYDDDFFDEDTAKWEEYNQNHFYNLAALLLGTVTLCLAAAYDEQKAEEDLFADIQKAESNFQSHAAFVASDQSVKLNSIYRHDIFKDAGVDKYIWNTMGDEKVRDSHRALDGQVFSYDDPPLIDGEPMNPGDDYGCRCSAEPIYEISSLNLPLVDEPNDMGAFNSDGNDNPVRAVNLLRWERARHRDAIERGTTRQVSEPEQNVHRWIQLTNSDDGGGNPYHDPKTGQFTFGEGGANGGSDGGSSDSKKKIDDAVKKVQEKQKAVDAANQKTNEEASKSGEFDPFAALMGSAPGTEAGDAQKELDEAKAELKKLDPHNEALGNDRSTLWAEHPAEGKNISDSFHPDPNDQRSTIEQVAEQQGFNRKPTVMTDKDEFNRAIVDSKNVCYRTVNDFEGNYIDDDDPRLPKDDPSLSPMENINRWQEAYDKLSGAKSSEDIKSEMLEKDGVQYNGDGQQAYGGGLYFMTGEPYTGEKGPEGVYENTNEWGKSDAYNDGTGVTMTGVLDGSARVANFYDMRKDFQYLPIEEKEKFGYDVGAYACALGYDAMKADDILTVFNRTKMVMLDDREDD